MLNSLKFNLANTPIRRETLHGKTYIVAPMAMLTEGVHNGSGGPLLYRAEDIKRATPSWNMKPIVVYHPQINGLGVSACDPDVLEAQQVGVVMKAGWNNGKLRAEAWIDETRAAAVDGRVLEALEQNRVMEVSTGLFTDNKEEAGDWNGKTYTAVALNHQPDHLALLPDQIGACSVADGAGLLQLNEAATSAGMTGVDRMLAREMDWMRRLVGNALSHSSLQQALGRALDGRFPGRSVWVMDVYEGKVIYEEGLDGNIKLFSLGYTKTENGVELSTDEPVEVVRVTEYRTLEGKFVGNQARTTTRNRRMDKSKLIDGLIENEATVWTEADRDMLMNMDESLLDKMTPTATPPGVVPVTPVAGAAGAAVEVPQPLTTEGYIAAAPPEIRDVLQNGLAAHEQEKRQLITAITTNTANVFTPEFLGTKSIAELKGIAALAATPQKQNGAPPMFFGQAVSTPGAITDNAAGAAGDTLALPTMDFGEKKS